MDGFSHWEGISVEVVGVNVVGDSLISAIVHSHDNDVI